ncbi:hypothetical protein K457DRAFT_129518 [Linnemannia elongata AG-77]|uniref:Uncharacterized protein n=1 Tax=Linnemannia elongata AG-77 TaxID=1314771 RepID=A0A197JI00_9FUNG|nr:hypothetical protein K457DRAFT_129518 [Linnemannia elongata AG-77]
MVLLLLVSPVHKYSLWRVGRLPAWHGVVLGMKVVDQTSFRSSPSFHKASALHVVENTEERAEAEGWSACSFHAILLLVSLLSDVALVVVIVVKRTKDGTTDTDELA